jgi:MMPL family
VVALGLVSLLGLAFDLSFLVTNMITMIGLAVGIDYSLFTVSRYREERAHGHDKLAAIGAAGGTANRAALRVPVLFRRRQQDLQRPHGFWAVVARPSASCAR